MFGKNEVTGPFRVDDGSLKVVKMFYTMQGEGPDSGRPAIFFRLSHCNLRCWFCDTDFDKGEVWSINEIEQRFDWHLFEAKSCNLVVVTGGEPLLQNILPVVEFLNSRGVEVSVETAGLCHFDGLERWFAPDRSINGNMIVCSPKTKKVHPKLVPLVGAWKYVVKSGYIDEETGLPILSTQKEAGYEKLFSQSPNERVAPIYIQPMDEQLDWKNEVNIQAALKVCMRFGYRLSLQTHKIVGVE